MFTIYCTARLRQRTGLAAEPSIREPTTALGNWYANLIYISHRQMFLFVSDGSRLAVVTPAKGGRSLASYLNQQLASLLEQLDARPEWIQAELREMAEVHYGAAQNRSVLGTMNDFKFQVETMLTRSPEPELLEISHRLSDIPTGPKPYHFPNDMTLELLKSRYL